VKLVFIDSEPPAKSGGGIRTYIQLILNLCHENNIQTVVYSHNPSVYTDVESKAIERTPLDNFFQRNFLYRFSYSLNIKLEYSHWLYHEIKSSVSADTLVEFCDFGGYAYYCLKDQKLRNRIIVKIHTPEFLIVKKRFGSFPFITSGYLERYCLKNTVNLTAPSPDFVREKLPEFSLAKHMPNPLAAPASLPVFEQTGNHRHKFVFIGRIEERKGIESMLEAFQQLADAAYLFTLTLIGYWPESTFAGKILARINSLRMKSEATIEIKGELSKSELWELIQGASCSIIPSLWENSPYVFFESVKSGLYTLGSDTGEMGRFLKHINGAVFTPGDSGSLFTCLRHVFENPEEIQKVVQRQMTYYTECYNKNKIINKEFYLSHFT